VKKRLLRWVAVVLLAVSVLLVAWQGSFNMKSFGPANSRQTLIFWAASLLIFVIMMALGFLLFQEFAKLWIARQSDREGSRIRTKLVLGALALSAVPVVCLVLFSFEVLGHNVQIWLTKPVDQERQLFNDVATKMEREMRDQVKAQVALLAAQPETIRALTGGPPTPPHFLEQFARDQRAESAALFAVEGDTPVDSWGPYNQPASQERAVRAECPVRDGGKIVGLAELTATIPLDIQGQLHLIETYNRQWTQLKDGLVQAKFLYTLVMILIGLFALFVTTWIAVFLARQISVPISAILHGFGEVRRGNLEHRVEVRAVDELALLVRGFNQMTQDLESSSRELDRRRRFTEAILESIPTGVISIGADGYIKRVNRALSKILPASSVERATRLEDLFSREDTAEIKYLMKRARRTGTASRQLELRTESRKLQLAVTVSALEEKLTSGFVLVLEDTSELLRAQKAAAWHEVARRVAHEIKNPLTPMALSAERIGRQIERLDLPPSSARILRECAGMIAKSVESVKTLVDEFSQFARFPSAQPARADLNEVVTQALAVFHGRLDGISIQTSFAEGLPPVNLDREQFERVVINLVDNAAEAMQDSLVKELYIATQAGTAETVELVVADSGCGVSPDDKEKLFLPYFSTKGRGTGLGLAIVSHIVAEHGAQIRVEDNQPVGARFTVELPALVESEMPEAAPPVGSPQAGALAPGLLVATPKA
jgi:two-component system, NtrC family, nitrogen regulation sensor histidine kinase NtrY